MTIRITKVGDTALKEGLAVEVRAPCVIMEYPRGNIKSICCYIMSCEHSGCYQEPT